MRVVVARIRADDAPERMFRIVSPRLPDIVGRKRRGFDGGKPIHLNAVRPQASKQCRLKDPCVIWAKGNTVQISSGMSFWIGLLVRAD